MRTARFLTVLSILFVFFVVSANAQRTRRPARRPAPKPTPTPVRPIVTAEVTAAKRKVDTQRHNVNVFVEVMGDVAVAIETADKDAAARRLNARQIEANNKNKQKTIDAIRVLRAALVDLETEFRTKPQLAVYLPKIQGISALGAQAEDHAIAGRFVASKDPLRQAALKLNDTLAVLPGPLPPSNRVAPRTVPASTQNRPVSTVPAQNRPVSSSSPTTSTGKSAPSLGMTPNEVMQTSWGAPSSKRTNQSRTTEVWTYSGNRSIYFYNGKVSNIVQ